MTVSAIVTIPPYAPFIDEVVNHPIVSGVRLNTVMPVKGTLEDLLKRLHDQARDKKLWVDLKCRQLRVVGYGVPPFTEIEISHPIKVNTPVTAYFGDKEQATVLEVDGRKLIMQDGPKRVVGPGESVNIIDPSLCIEGYFTDTDLRYIEAGQKVGVDTYMLSFVEQRKDVEKFKKIYPQATVVAKIESQKGLRYVRNEWKGEARLMAARGDLYMEVGKPHDIIRASEDIVCKDAKAIAASRIFESLAHSLEPSCSDIGDADNLLRMGYRTLMFGDEVCMRRESIISALNLLSAIADRYGGI